MPIDINDLQSKAATGNSSLGSSVINTSPNGQNGLGINNSQVVQPEVLYTRIAYIATWALGSLAFLIIIFGAVKYITAGGDAEKAESGKKTLIGAVIGIIVIVAAYAVYQTTVGLVANDSTTNSIQSQVNATPGL